MFERILLFKMQEPRVKSVIMPFERDSSRKPFKSVMMLFDTNGLCDDIHFCKASQHAHYYNYTHPKMQTHWFALTEDGYLEKYPENMVSLHATHYFIIKIDGVTRSIRNSRVLNCDGLNYSDYIEEFALDCVYDLNSAYEVNDHKFEVDIFKINNDGSTDLIKTRVVNVNLLDD